MVDALTVIEREHRRLGAVLACLVALTDEVDERDARPDFATFRAIFAYLGSFLDRFHHPKEDAYLFRALLKRRPEARAAIAAIEAEHAREPSMLAKMRATLDDYERDRTTDAFNAFRNAVRDYVEFERAHAHGEERDIFPLAREYLLEGDWAEIDAAFQAHDDPLFGDQPSAEFQDLFTAIVERIPAPHGFGAKWDKE